MKIWTEKEFIDVDPDDIGELEAAMHFKAEHIKAKADPELFEAVAHCINNLWNAATKNAVATDSTDIVRCKDCEKWHGDIGWCDEHSQFVDSEGIVCHPSMSSEWKMFFEEDYCSRGKRRENK